MKLKLATCARAENRRALFAWHDASLVSALFLLVPLLVIFKRPALYNNQSTREPEDETAQLKYGWHQPRVA
jgi:hypothetical protein